MSPMPLRVNEGKVDVETTNPDSNQPVSPTRDVVFVPEEQHDRVRGSFYRRGSGPRYSGASRGRITDDVGMII